MPALLIHMVGVRSLEKEVKRKTATYGTAAILIALMLAAFAYNFGIQLIIQPTFSPLRTFTSYSEMESFLRSNMDKAKTFSSEPQLLGLRGTQEANFLVGDMKAAPEYSTTNIQVAGVDEADIRSAVKVGQFVKDRPADLMKSLADRLTGTHLSTAAPSCGCPADQPMQDGDGNQG